jgi:hypothetical protein
MRRRKCVCVAGEVEIGLAVSSIRQIWCFPNKTCDVEDYVVYTHSILTTRAQSKKKTYFCQVLQVLSSFDKKHPRHALSLQKKEKEKNSKKE